jgi:hypothetical protein
MLAALLKKKHKNILLYIQNREQRRRILRRSMHTWGHDAYMQNKEIQFEILDWIHLA